MNPEEEPYKKVLKKENPLKEWIIDYVGTQQQPDNDEVTVEMVVEAMVREFPEFVFALAEENFLRGYTQAFTDMEAVASDVAKSQESSQNDSLGGHETATEAVAPTVTKSQEINQNNEQQENG